MGRFKVRWGDVEVEYEGEDSEEKYASALEYVKDMAPAQQRSKERKPEEGEETLSRRGGQRSAVVGPRIDELISEGWFSKHKRVMEIVQELKNRAVPGVTNDNVYSACLRRVNSKKLKSIMDEGDRVFWAE